MPGGGEEGGMGGGEEGRGCPCAPLACSFLFLEREERKKERKKDRRGRDIRFRFGLGRGLDG